MRARQSGTTLRWIIPGLLALGFLWFARAAYLPRLAAAPDQLASVTLSIVGTSDLHGAAFPKNGLGGLPLLSGYVNNLRVARASDGGAVLLLDSGDTFQGGIESNLSEGALVVDAYNAMGYTAAAVGNHDFDFGSVDSPTARQLPGDLRGALKARAAQARYPFLAANLIDDATGRPVEWPNVRPSVLVDAAGVKVGVLGVMTIDALRSTLAANVQGLRSHRSRRRSSRRPRSFERRPTSHRRFACGRAIERFDQPTDLSSCDYESEISGSEKPAHGWSTSSCGHTHAASCISRRHRHHPALLRGQF